MHSLRPRLAACVVLLSTSWLAAQNVPVQEFTLENGMRFLLLPRPGDPNVSAGWVARVGSVNERPGITGTAHLFEHMMFKGTRVIGTRDIEEDLRLISELDRVKKEMAIEEEKLQERLRFGEISDAMDPAVRSPRHRELRARFEQLLERQKTVLVKDEFDRIYTAAGASGMNAGTAEDFTIYFINVPANKLELWFWMESDRLLNPVFREFYSERDVVREERRLRVESTPTGKYEEQFRSIFWAASPYSWPVIGWPCDVEAITREEAMAFYGVYYAPNNLSACLVGDFSPEEARRLARRYFGRLRTGPRPPPVVRTREVEQVAEKRMVAHADTSPQVVLRYHTVADGHADEPALMVLQELLNGRTGRLYKRLVVEELATSARASHNGMKYDGFFEIRAVARPEHPPEKLEKDIGALIAEMGEKAVPDRELQKVKNRLAASEFRKLRSNFSLLIQLLLREVYRGWETINTDPALFQAVTPEDVRRVAERYFTESNRNVLLYYTKEKEGGSDTAASPAAGLPPDQAERIRQLEEALPRLGAEQARKMLAQLEPALASAPEEQRPFLEAVKATVEAYLAGSEAEVPDSEASPDPDDKDTTADTEESRSEKGGAR